jgi:hypothetical protein
VIKYRSAQIQYFEEHRVEERVASLNSKLLIAQTCSEDDALQIKAID